jgi:adenylate kinase
VSTLFVGGAHGAGKSTLCESLKDALEADHVMASDLADFVAQVDGRHAESAFDLARSQGRLVIALRSIERHKPNILLDGHYCLTDQQGRIAHVPLEVFTQIRPAALLVVEIEIELLAQRLKRRGNDRPDLDILIRGATAERSHALFVSRALELPIMFWHSADGVETALSFFLAAVGVN